MPFQIDEKSDFADLIATQAAERLRETNRLLTIAERLANLGRWRFDPNEPVVERSLQVSNIVGVGADQPLTPKAVLAMIHPADRPSLLRCALFAYNGIADTSCRVRLCTPAGTERTILVHAQSDARGKGKCKTVFGIARDIT